MQICEERYEDVLKKRCYSRLGVCILLKETLFTVRNYSKEKVLLLYTFSIQESRNVVM